MKQNRTLAAQFFGKPLRFAVDALFKGVMNPVCQVETEANARVPACRANSPVAADIAALDHDNPLEVGPKIVQMELSKKAGANAAVGQSRQ